MTPRGKALAKEFDAAQAKLSALHGELSRVAAISIASPTNRAQIREVEARRAERDAEATRLTAAVDAARAEVSRINAEMLAERVAPGPETSDAEQEIDRRRADAEQRAERARAERGKYVLAAAQGSEPAKKKLAKLAEQEDAATREALDLALAVTAQRVRDGEARREYAERDADLRVEAAQEIASRRIARARGIDAALAMIASELLADKADHTALMKTGCGNTDYLNPMVRPEALQRAMAEAGIPNPGVFEKRSLTETFVGCLNFGVQRPAVNTTPHAA